MTRFAADGLYQPSGPWTLEEWLELLAQQRISPGKTAATDRLAQTLGKKPQDARDVNAPDQPAAGTSTRGSQQPVSEQGWDNGMGAALLGNPLHGEPGRLETRTDAELQAIINDESQPAEQRKKARAVLYTRLGKGSDRPLPNATIEKEFELDAKAGWQKTASKNTMSNIVKDVETQETAPKATSKGSAGHANNQFAQHQKQIQQGWKGEDDGSHSFPYKDKDGAIRWKNYRPEGGEPLTYSQARKKFFQDAESGAIDGEPIKPTRPVGGADSESEQKAVETKKALRPTTTLHKPEVGVTFAEGDLIEERKGSVALYDNGGPVTALSADGKVGSKYKIGANGIEANLEAEGSAKLVAIDLPWSFELDPCEIMGEQFSGRVFFYIKGMVGAEAQSQDRGQCQAHGKQQDLRSKRIATGNRAANLGGWQERCGTGEHQGRPER